MPPKKSKQKKKKGKKTKRGHGFFRFASFLVLALLLTGTIFLAFRTIFLYPDIDLKDTVGAIPGERTKSASKPPELDKGLQKKRPAEPERDRISPAPARKSPSLPLAAIVIDDMGYEKRVGEELIGLDLALSFAFLPDGPHTPELLVMADIKRRDILLHQPMEPLDTSWNPGPGALYLSMSGEAVAKMLQQNLALVPKAIAVNNHMGSRFTADKKAMSLFMAEVRRQRLYFLDSVTTPLSTGRQVAEEMGVKTGSRDVFLDVSLDQDQITAQLQRLCELARERGSAIAIGHSKKETLEALRRNQSFLRQQIRLVGFKELVDSQGKTVALR